MTNAVIPGHKPLKTPVCHGISRGFAPISGLRAAKEANMLRTTLIALTLAATPALALVPINENPEIHDKLLQGFIGDAIADNCPTMKARTLKALKWTTNGTRLTNIVSNLLRWPEDSQRMAWYEKPPSTQGQRYTGRSSM